MSEARIELFEASGPVSPRFQYTTKITILGRPGALPTVVREHRDAAGEHHDEHELDRAVYEVLLADLLAALPLGEPLDLVSSKRDRKGVSFNHVTLIVGEASTRLDYLLSDVDDEDGVPRARAVVGAIKRAAEKA
jgi:hypothetical protein